MVDSSDLGEVKERKEATESKEERAAASSLLKVFKQLGVEALEGYLSGLRTGINVPSLITLTMRRRA